MFGGIQTQYKTYDMKNPECKQVNRVQRTEPDSSRQGQAQSEIWFMDFCQAQAPNPKIQKPKH